MCTECGLVGSRASASRRGIITAAATGAIALGSAALALGSAALPSPVSALAPRTPPTRRGHRPGPADLRGTSLHLLGTAGGPVWYPGTTRSGISSAVVVDGAVYLVDCGDGALKRFREAGLGAVDHDFAGFENLRAVLLTHLHPDHYADLPGLYLFAPVLGLARGAFSPVKLLLAGQAPRPRAATHPPARGPASARAPGTASGSTDARTC